MDIIHPRIEWTLRKHYKNGSKIHDLAQIYGLSYRKIQRVVTHPTGPSNPFKNPDKRPDLK